MYTQELPIVDLRHSDWKEEESQPELGIMVFGEGGKRYVSYKDPAQRPPWHFWWCRYTPTNGYQDLADANARWGYTPVTLNDGFWPEGLPCPDVNGKFTNGDTILVKCPIQNYLKRRKHEIGLSETMAKRVKQEWHNRLRSEQQAGPGGMDVDESLLRSLG